MPADTVPPVRHTDRPASRRTASCDSEGDRAHGCSAEDAVVPEATAGAGGARDLDTPIRGVLVRIAPHPTLL